MAEYRKSFSLTARGTLLRRISPCLRLAHVERSSLLVARALATWKRILSTGSIARIPRLPLPPLVAALCTKGVGQTEPSAEEGILCV